MVDGSGEFRVLVRTGDGWLEAPDLRRKLGYGPSLGLRCEAIVPTNVWKIEVRVGTQREIRIGRFRHRLPWRTNVWTSAELLGLRAVEAQLP